ncbi:MAG: hypothetical protein HY877_04945, partial [Deltaproteobacteria bacterium]|nr:hypothetical protein [Deltaproteobacteria bacterium]
FEVNVGQSPRCRLTVATSQKLSSLYSLRVTKVSETGSPVTSPNSAINASNFFNSPGNYIVDGICQGSLKNNKKLFCGKTTQQANIIVGVKTYAGRLNANTALVVLPSDTIANLPPSLQNAVAYRILRKENLSGATSTVGQVDAQTMREKGFIDNGLSPHINYSYAIQTVTATGPGETSLWRKTYYYPGKLVFTFDHFPLPGSPTSFSFSFIMDHSKPADTPNAVDIRLMGARGEDPFRLVVSSKIRRRAPTLYLNYWDWFNIPFSSSLVTQTKEGYMTLGLNGPSGEVVHEASDYTDSPAHKAIMWFVGDAVMQTEVFNKDVKRQREEIETGLTQGRPTIEDCSFEGNQFVCELFSNNFGMAPLVIPTPHQLLGQALVRFFYDVQDPESGLLRSNAWRYWLDQKTGLDPQFLYSHMQSGSFALINPTDPLQTVPYAMALATVMAQKMLEADADPTVNAGNDFRTPPNWVYTKVLGNRGSGLYNLFRAGSTWTGDWEKIFDDLFYKRFASPLLENIRTAATLIPADETALRISFMKLFIGLQQAYQGGYHGRYTLGELTKGYSELYKLMEVPDKTNYNGAGFLGEYINRPIWPGEVLDCGGPCTTEETMRFPKCGDGDYADYIKKLGGYEYSGRHVDGYLQVLARAQHPRNAAFQRVLATIMDAHRQGKVLFKTLPVSVGGQEVNDTKSIELNKFHCLRIAEDENTQGILLHEGAHLVHDLVIPDLDYQTVQTQGGEAYANHLANRYWEWTEYRAYRFGLCTTSFMANEWKCNNERDFLYERFFNPNGWDWYRKFWSEIGLCTQNHDLITKKECQNVDDLDWLPIGDVCNPYTETRGNCPDLP